MIQVIESPGMMRKQPKWRAELAEVGYRSEQIEALAESAKSSSVAHFSGGVAFKLATAGRQSQAATKQLARLRRHGSRKMKVAVRRSGGLPPHEALRAVRAALTQ